MNLITQYKVKENKFKRILKCLYIRPNISSVGFVSVTARSTVLLTMRVNGG